MSENLPNLPDPVKSNNPWSMREQILALQKENEQMVFRMNRLESFNNAYQERIDKLTDSLLELFEENKRLREENIELKEENEKYEADIFFKGN